DSPFFDRNPFNKPVVPSLSKAAASSSVKVCPHISPMEKWHPSLRPEQAKPQSVFRSSLPQEGHFREVIPSLGLRSLNFTSPDIGVPSSVYSRYRQTVAP